MEELKIKKIIISKQAEDSENFQKFKQIVNKRKIPVIIVGSKVPNTTKKQNINSNKSIESNEIICKDIIQIEKDLYFEILWPGNQNLLNENSLNNNSIVTKLHYKNFSMLFTGDIEKIAEKQIIEEYKNNLQILNSTVLKVAHHGSKTSSIQEFIEVVKPKISIIGVGENNKFGHPNDDVIARLQNIGSKIYRTDKMGEISIAVNNKGIIKIKKFIKCN